MRASMESKHTCIAWLSLFTASLTPNLNSIRFESYDFLLWMLCCSSPTLCISSHSYWFCFLICCLLQTPEAWCLPYSTLALSPHFMDISVTFALPFLLLPFVRAKPLLGTKPSIAKFTGGVPRNGTTLADGFAFQKTQFFPCFSDVLTCALTSKIQLELSNKDRVRCSVDTQSH